jgi:hypothetical protein
MSTAYYILKNEAAPEWSSITMDQLKAIAKSNGFKLQRSSSDDGWVLYDGSYMHVGLAQDGTVTYFERFGGNDVQDMLEAIRESLGKDQFIASEHDSVVEELFEALTPTSTSEDVATYIYDHVAWKTWKSMPHQGLSTEQYVDKIYDETMHEMVNFAPATEAMTVEEFIETFWPQQAEEIRDMIYKRIYADM